MLSEKVNILDVLKRISQTACLWTGVVVVSGSAGVLDSNPAWGQTFDSGVINTPIMDSGILSLAADPTYFNLTVPQGTGIITDLNTLLNIDHEYVGDITIGLTSPEGTFVSLLDRPGVPASSFGNSDGLGGSYTFDDEAANPFPEFATGGFPVLVPPGEYQSAELLAAFNGEIADGDWTLTIQDLAGTDPGQLNFWQLIIQATPMAMGGEIFGTSAQANIQSLNMQYRMLRDQIANANRSRGNDGIALRFPVEQSSPAYEMQISEFNGEDIIVRGQGCTETVCGLNGWLIGYGAGGNVGAKGNVGNSSYSTGGGQFGLYDWIDDSNMTGLFGGYNHQDVRVSAPNSSADVDNGILGLFYRHGSYQDYLLAAASLGYDDYETFRQGARGQTDGIQGALYLEKGWTKRVGCFEVTPSTALQYSALQQNGFTETGINGIQVLGQDTHSLRSTIGLDVLGKQRCTEFGFVNFDVSGHWMHEYLDTNTTTSTAIGGATFATPGLDFGRDWAIIGTGLRLERSMNMSLYAGYDLQINARQSIHSGTGGVLYQY